MAKKIEQTKEEQEVYQNLKKLSKRANQRLVRLERAFGKDRWGAKELRSLLDVEPLQAWTKAGRVRAAKSMSLNNMLIVTKAIEDWLQNKRSYVGKVKKIEKQIKEGIRANIAREREVKEEEITSEDIENFYRTLEDENYQTIYKYIKPSNLNALIEEAKEDEEAEDYFVDKVIRYANYGNDNNVKRSLERILRLIYKKDVKK